MSNALSWLVTFGFVVMSFVLFRSPNLSTAFRIYGFMAPQSNLLGVDMLRRVVPFTLVTLGRPMVLGLIVVFFFKTTNQLAEQMRFVPATAFATAGLFLLAMFFMNSTTAKTFIYFAF